MPRKLTWDEVSAILDRESVERYGRYLRVVVESETYVPRSTATPSLVNRIITLGVIYDWCRRHHGRRRLHVTVRAFAWCARYCYSLHPAFARLGIESADIVEALEWIANDSYSFRFAPFGVDGVLLVGEHKEADRRERDYFFPVLLVAPQVERRKEISFSLRMSAKLVAEAMLQSICIAEDDGTYYDTAIRVTVRDLLEVAAPLVTSG